MTNHRVFTLLYALAALLVLEGIYLAHIYEPGKLCLACMNMAAGMSE